MDSATCIVGVIHKGIVWMGADAAASEYEKDRLTVLADKKVFMREDAQNNKWLFGFGGIYRFGQIIEYCFNIPRFEENESTLAYMIRRFVPAMQKCMQEFNFGQSERGRSLGGNLMVGIQGKLFTIGTSYSVQETVYEYDALGCAESVAFGSLYSTANMEPESRVRLALEAAEKFCPAVRGPFTIIHT